MKKLKVSMRWGGSENRQWMMDHLSSGYFLMNFPDCKNVNKSFQGMNKQKTNKFLIIIHPIGKDDLKDQ